ncbi:MoxR family ATPase [Motiliproteus sp. SC1-56]|uniref:AAA family ATPase n=1 Tax=Motiliproteus sp. SC1-56 TaxID=2799565 RepID=UPI001A8D4E7B|nr:AAA family ATPase [Motiliproteus sp. SC1-56]
MHDGGGLKSSVVSVKPGLIDQLLAAMETVVLGKRRQLKLALACLLARGHLLIEDLPGMGKTTLAQTVARVLGFEFTRIQFTSDLLPADIIGASVFDSREGRFSFQRGPVFTQLLLADEINRATPKAQSALLEAMEERQVSVEGETHPLPDPFFVIATQNPLSQMGTFPLPESQLDRFLMRLELGYPDPRAERQLFLGGNPRLRLDALEAGITLEQLHHLQAQVERIHLSESLVDYVQRLVDFSRQGGDFDVGLSPRGALALIRSARAWALLEGRDYVVPEDVQQVLPSVAEHRLRGALDHTGHRGESLARRLLDGVEVVE